MPGWYDILGYSPSPEDLLNIKVASPADDAAAAAALLSKSAAILAVDPDANTSLPPVKKKARGKGSR